MPRKKKYTRKQEKNGVKNDNKVYINAPLRDGTTKHRTITTIKEIKDNKNFAATVFAIILFVLSLVLELSTISLTEEYRNPKSIII